MQKFKNDWLTYFRDPDKTISSKMKLFLAAVTLGIILGVAVGLS